MNGYLVKILKLDDQQTQQDALDSNDDLAGPELVKQPLNKKWRKPGGSLTANTSTTLVQGESLLIKLYDQQQKKILAETINKHCPGRIKKPRRPNQPPNGMTEAEAIAEQERLIEQGKHFIPVNN